MKKLKRFDETVFSNVFLGSLILVFYRQNSINNWEAVRVWNHFCKKKDITLEQVLDFLVKTMKKPICLKNVAIVCNEKGKWAPLATTYIKVDGKKHLLPISANIQLSETNILSHLDDADTKVIYYEGLKYDETDEE